MTISERILKVLKDRNMTQAEFAKQLLTGKGIEDEENINVTSRESCFTPYDIQLVQDYH